MLKGLGIAGLIFSACIGIPLGLIGLSMLGSADLSSIIIGVVISAFVGISWVGSVALLALGSQSNSEYVRLKSNRDKWRSQLLSTDDRQQVVSRFGDLTSTQFKQLYEERLAFLQPLLGGDFQKYLVVDNTFANFELASTGPHI